MAEVGDRDLADRAGVVGERDLAVQDLGGAVGAVDAFELDPPPRRDRRGGELGQQAGGAAAQGDEADPWNALGSAETYLVGLNSKYIKLVKMSRSVPYSGDEPEGLVHSAGVQGELTCWRQLTFRL